MARSTTRRDIRECGCTRHSRPVGSPRQKTREGWLLNIQTRPQLADATVLGVIRVATGVIWLIALLSILDAWGIALAGLWGVLVSAIAVIGVGFLATWAMISNFTASFFLAIWRPFRLGDTIVLLPENTTGRVIGRNLMFTVISEQDGSGQRAQQLLFSEDVQSFERASGCRKDQ